MVNPYSVGKPATGQHFYGRQALIAEIIEAGPHPVFVLGRRQIGKTSLLRQIETLVPALFLDVQFASGRASHLTRQLGRELRRKCRDFLWLASVPTSEGDDMYTLLEAINDAAEEQGQTLWILMDETEGLLSAPQADAVSLNRLRGIFQHYRALGAVLVASKTLSQADLRSSKGMSPFLSGFAMYYLANLTPEAAQVLICQSQASAPVQVDEALIVELIDCTGGHPLLLRLLCRELFDAGRLRPPRDQDIDNVLTQVRHMGIFEADFRYLSDAERRLLRAVSQAGQVAAPDLVEIADPIYLHGLTQLGYLRRMGSSYAIGDQFLARWLPSAPWEALSDVSDAGTLDLYRREELRKAIVQRFDLEELRTLCADVGVDYDNLGGEGKQAKVRELIAYLERRGELEQLVKAVRGLRP